MPRSVGILLACEPSVDVWEEPRRCDPTVCWECVEELDDIVRWRDTDCDADGGPVIPRDWQDKVKKICYATETYLGK